MIFVGNQFQFKCLVVSRENSAIEILTIFLFRFENLWSIAFV